MSIIDYKCSKCGKIIEKFFLKTNDIVPDNVICSYCKGLSKKIMSSSNFKVNGYSYKNGYSKEK